MSLIKWMTLKDNTELRNLILENPGLPLVVFVHQDAYDDNGYQYSQSTRTSACVENITLYGDCWMSEEDLEEKLNDTLADEEEYEDLSDEEFEEMIQQKIAETEFIEAIVIYVV